MPWSLFLKRLTAWMPYLLILMGIVLRIMVYLANHCLFIDEANIALNIYERGYAGMFRYLDYNQFAPPLFLCALKFATSLLGYSEFAFRLFPFLFSIASLWIFWQVLKAYFGNTALSWYPLALLAIGFIFIRYAAEAKQYSSDVFITLLLVLAALRLDISTLRSWKFAVVWAGAGTVAIWYSMPSVFILLGVGCSYLYNVIKSRDYKKIWLLAFPGLLWACSFGLYYMLLLRQQISSGYLRWFHEFFFLNIPPKNIEQAKRDCYLILTIFKESGGYYILSIAFHMLTAVLGAFWLLRRHTSKALVVIVPGIAVLVACALHKFTMLDRVMLFSMPLLLILIGAGIQGLLQNPMPVKLLVVVVCIINAWNFLEIRRLVKRTEKEDITAELKFLQKSNIRASQLYVNNLAKPAYDYYTKIHPGKTRWAVISGAFVVEDNANYDSLAGTVPDTMAILYSWVDDATFASRQQDIKKHKRELSRNEVTGCKAIIYRKY